MKLIDMVSFLYSKNAGPYAVTFDMIFKDKEAYDLARASGAFTRENLAKAMSVLPERVLSLYTYDAALVIKFTLRREISSGDFGDRSVFGSQHWPPLTDFEVPDRIGR